MSVFGVAGFRQGDAWRREPKIGVKLINVIGRAVPKRPERSDEDQAHGAAACVTPGAPGPCGNARNTPSWNRARAAIMAVVAQDYAPGQGRVAVLGLGTIGAGMARSLLRAGLPVENAS